MQTDDCVLWASPRAVVCVFCCSLLFLCLPGGRSFSGPLPVALFSLEPFTMVKIKARVHGVSWSFFCVDWDTRFFSVFLFQFIESDAISYWSCWIVCGFLALYLTVFSRPWKLLWPPFSWDVSNLQTYVSFISLHGQKVYVCIILSSVHRFASALCKSLLNQSCCLVFQDSLPMRNLITNIDQWEIHVMLFCF
jgi:hypothetical protein